MHLLPFLKELLAGWLGFAIICWIALIIWLGAKRRIGSLAIMLAITATAFSLFSYWALGVSFRPSPNRDTSLLMSCAFVMFGFGAAICFTTASALGLGARKSRDNEKSKSSN